MKRRSQRGSRGHDVDVRGAELQPTRRGDEVVQLRRQRGALLYRYKGIRVFPNKTQRALFDMEAGAKPVAAFRSGDSFDLFIEVDLAEPLQALPQDRFFVIELSRILDVLPVTAARAREIGARGFLPVCGWRDELFDTSGGVVLPSVGNLDLHNIAWRCARHKHDAMIGASQPRATINQFFNRHLHWFAAPAGAKECSPGRAPGVAFRTHVQPRRGVSIRGILRPSGAVSLGCDRPRARARGYTLSPLRGLHQIEQAQTRNVETFHQLSAPHLLFEHCELFCGHRRSEWVQVGINFTLYFNEDGLVGRDLE
jgi:hypothetical protein